MLELYSGASGAGYGYHLAGFATYCIDLDPKVLRHCPFPYLCMDALGALVTLNDGQGLTFSDGRTLYLSDVDAIHAAPMCQGYSRLRHLPWLKGRVWPLEIEPVRELLLEAGKPYVIENVMDAPLKGAWLCGRMFGLPLYRHRRFETNWRFWPPHHMKHGVVIGHGRMVNDRRKGTLNAGSSKGAWGTEQGVVTVAGGQFKKADAVRAMEIDWMTNDEIAEATPPAMTHCIGKQLMAVLNG